ncbi:hypothetical protein MHM84_03760 [Halomonas sp. McH1-25]|uniref:hypothetical protein n=1 Tax=unclassified Halomonas TaxID=2609666 RepID=UPI001EF545B1|nr:MULTISPECIES: hypothetical protein [unclassified Halomonas]MCG7598889.1 hypothetical protein [Halomonas sp. McH1-25]MCP1340852.1 hypothetical protein [Halomonas sp. FL8]MCP1361265.1 hypothetical protein [Halomonas sp. BBD45]MCP1363755.1 hypothetical protein [Halomonas sp. BBD48]
MGFEIRLRKTPHEWYEYQGARFLICIPHADLMEEFLTKRSETHDLALLAAGGPRYFFSHYVLIDWEGVVDSESQEPIAYSPRVAHDVLSAHPDLYGFVQESFKDLMKRSEPEAQ